MSFLPQEDRHRRSIGVQGLRLVFLESVLIHSGGGMGNGLFHLEGDAAKKSDSFTKRFLLRLLVHLDEGKLLMPIHNVGPYLS